MVFYEGQNKLDIVYRNHKTQFIKVEKKTHCYIVGFNRSCARKADMLESNGIKITKYVSETILPDLLKNMSILGANGALKNQSG